MPLRLPRSRAWLALASLGLFVSPALNAAEKSPVIVHEWGTFTVLQDANGRSIGGVNVDDEPVPNFVCQGGGPEVVPEHFAAAKNFGLPPYNPLSKGWWIGDPSVTMRLETPVIYIYPPKGELPKSVLPLTVHVDFHGGVLSQFYPEADFSNAGDFREFKLNSETTTGLTWNAVRLGSDRKPVESTDKVWTTPRETRAPLLEMPTHTFDVKGNRVPNVTAEHFLFYRGVGHLPPPYLARERYDAPGALEVGSDADPELGTQFPMWLVEIRPDSRCAFRRVTEDAGMVSGGVTYHPKIPLSFADSSFKESSLADLKKELREELVTRGLYPDEASAMLRTWELSYFQSPGLRIFYIVPNKWVNSVLPLKIDGAPAKITRVMVGRTELISGRQQAALQRLAAGPCPDLQPVKEAAAKALEAGKYTEAQKDAFYSGDRPLRELGISIPPLVQDYLDLGRFRDALIVHEQETHPSAALAEFISKNRLVAPAAASTANGAVGVAASISAR